MSFFICVNSSNNGCKRKLRWTQNNSDWVIFFPIYIKRTMLEKQIASITWSIIQSCSQMFKLVPSLWIYARAWKSISALGRNRLCDKSYSPCFSALSSSSRYFNSRRRGRSICGSNKLFMLQKASKTIGSACWIDRRFWFLCLHFYNYFLLVYTNTRSIYLILFQQRAICLTLLDTCDPKTHRRCFYSLLVYRVA